MWKKPALVVSFLFAGAAAAQEIGPEDVIPVNERDAIMDCLRESGRDAQLACFDRPKVTPGARALALSLYDSTDMVPILENVIETGAVDVAEVMFPMMANTNWQMALVNGAEGPLLATDLNFRRTPPAAPSTLALLARHPNAFESGHVAVAAMRPLPGGGQRFVLTDIVTDGCRACPPVAMSVRYFDFNEGRMTGQTELGWQPITDLGDPAFAARLQQGDVAALQAGLNLAGYDAGPVDGARGPRTAAAFAAFHGDHCLADDGPRISKAALRALTAPRPGFERPPCAPGSAPPAE